MCTSNRFDSDDLSAVQISRVAAPGGPVNRPTTVTIFGSAFAAYGTDQLRIKARNSYDGSERSIAGRLLGPERVLATIPSFARATQLDVSLSLSGGANSTFTNPAPITFGVYVPPTIVSVQPSVGDANGGTEVSIQGFGFTALNDDYLIQRRALRCSFGGTVQPLQPRFHNDTFILCVTTWGSEAPAGLKVGVALNGETFTTSEDVRFRFVGLYKPNIIDVYFIPEATSMIVQFDDQATNRAGMSGLAECSLMLEPSTMKTLQGTDSETPKCFWMDDSTVAIYLTTYTFAAPGMTVKVLNGVLWPKLWARAGQPDACVAEKSLCNVGLEMSVDEYFPCNLRSTDEREECTSPLALIRGPTAISSCPQTEIKLDGSRSSGGGIKPLIFSWAAHPILSDNARLITSALLSSGSTERVRLEASQLTGGRRFLFLLRVTNFLGVQSPEYNFSVLRDPLPIPTISIEAPPLFTFRSSINVTVQGKAALPACFANAKAILFTWTNPTTTIANGSASSARLTLGPSAGRRDLEIAGSSLQLGLTYSLLLTGCMKMDPSVCGTATTAVALVNEPLQTAIAGGDRLVGDSDNFVISACSGTFDPDDRGAELGFAWRCERTGGEPLKAPDRGCEALTLPELSSCTWNIGPGSSGGALSAGTYKFLLTASNLNTGEAVNTSVSIIVEADMQLPEVSIAPLASTKPSVAKKLVMQGIAAMFYSDGGSEVQATAAVSIRSYVWSVEPDVNLSSPLVSSTGTASPNLVILPGGLRAGAPYVFTLTATADNGRSAFARIGVQMNRAPFGGKCDCMLKPLERTRLSCTDAPEWPHTVHTLSTPACYSGIHTSRDST